MDREERLREMIHRREERAYEGPEDEERESDLDDEEADRSLNEQREAEV